MTTIWNSTVRSSWWVNCMSKNIRIEDLDEAIQETLTIYGQDVNKAIDKAGAKAVRELVKETKITAPEGKRGKFRESIASKVQKHARGNTYLWYVKGAEARLTHLLVHGHATKDGGRTRPNPFLKAALDRVLPEYEKRIEEALKNGK